MEKTIPEIHFWTKYDTKLFQLFSVINFFIIDEWSISSCLFFFLFFISVFSESFCFVLCFDELFFLMNKINFGLLNLLAFDYYTIFFYMPYNICVRFQFSEMYI